VARLAVAGPGMGDRAPRWRGGGRRGSGQARRLHGSLNPRWQTLLRDADAQFVLECLSEGREVPANRPSGYRARDCATINWFCDRAADDGLAVRSVRAIFEEGEPIFEASAIRTRSHVQIAIRDRSAILEAEEISW